MLKISAGSFKGRKLNSPPEKTTRPTSEKVRQAVFNSAQMMVDGSTFLDLYAGSGAMGLEAISRGAKMAVFVEKDKEAARCIQSNIDHLDVDEHSLLIVNEATKSIAHLECTVLTFDMIFIDPPYEDVKEAEQEIQKLLSLLDKSSILQKSGKLYLEFSAYSKLDFSKLKLSRLKWNNTKAYGRSKLEIFSY